MRVSSGLRSLILPSLSLAGFVLLWQAAVTGFRIRPIIVPAPGAVFAEIYSDFGWYMINAGHTLLTTLAGFMLSVVFGVAIAVMLVSVKWFENSVYPLIVSLNSVPKVAVAPLFVVWMGTGTSPQIAIAFLIAVFAIIVDAVHGLRSVPQDVMDLGRVLKGSAWDFFFKVRLPSAMPSILSGMKVAISLSLVGAIVGEFVASQRGLGNVILMAQGSFDTPRVFAALTILAVMGMLLFAALEMLERRVTHWRHVA
jgi:NitT/TauT family transport system permease protein